MKNLQGKPLEIAKTVHFLGQNYTASMISCGNRILAILLTQSPENSRDSSKCLRRKWSGVIDLWFHASLGS